MELSDLHIFRTVVSTGGVTRAADRLHRVQSNVTTRVRKLEEDLGVELFVREGRRLQLSPAGSVLLGYADRLLALASEAREALHESGPRGVLRLGSMESTAAARLPKPLSVLARRHPALTVELRTGAPRDLVPRVIAGDLEAALVAEPIDDERLATEVAWVEDYVIVAGPDHPPIRTPRDVHGRTLLVFEHGCPHRMRLEAWFAEHNVEVERLIEMGSYHAILGCAVAGMGIALLPKIVLDTFTERARLSLYPMTGRYKSARTLLIWRRNAPSARVRALADAIATTRERSRGGAR
ncbi:MAG: LysR substrate-binding domain-containing protein [Betaproteobacteria bacterium]